MMASVLAISDDDDDWVVIGETVSEIESHEESIGLGYGGIEVRKDSKCQWDSKASSAEPVIVEAEDCGENTPSAQEGEKKSKKKKKKKNKNKNKKPRSDSMGSEADSADWGELDMDQLDPISIAKQRVRQLSAQRRKKKPCNVQAAIAIREMQGMKSGKHQVC